MRSGSDQPPGNRFRRNRPSRPLSGTPQHSQPFNGHGTGDRVRGNASQMYQRYLTLAREAARMDDRVASEGYYQHAEHYFRIGNAGRDGNSAAAMQLPLQDDAATRPEEIAPGGAANPAGSGLRASTASLDQSEEG